MSTLLIALLALPAAVLVIFLVYVLACCAAWVLLVANAGMDQEMDSLRAALRQAEQMRNDFDARDLAYQAEIEQLKNALRHYETA